MPNSDVNIVRETSLYLVLIIFVLRESRELHLEK